MKPRRRQWLVVSALLAGGALVVWLARPPEPPTAARPALEPVSVLSAAGGDFARVERPRAFVFPDDHGAHRDFRHEWWYFTGNLHGPEGQPLGYQLTLFRFALAAEPAAPVAGQRSAWATRQVYMGHLALADIGSGRFFPLQRFAREALGLAGAEADPLRVWLYDWEIAGLPGVEHGFRLRAREGGLGVDLELRAAKPPIAQGDAGVSRKGPEPGNASHYYSYTRLATRGTVWLDGQARAVSGASWMDREWGSSALGPDLAGWDWFALQLEDGSELMFYDLRRRGEPRRSPFSGGVWVEAAGRAVTLAPEAVEIEVRAHWTSPRTGVRYPSRWRLAIPELALELDIRPRLADQELDLAVRYWEGAVAVEGERAARPVSGVGYVELAGYGASP